MYLLAADHLRYLLEGKGKSKMEIDLNKLAARDAHDLLASAIIPRLLVHPRMERRPGGLGKELIEADVYQRC
jgi:hypothetical protein